VQIDRKRFRLPVAERLDQHLAWSRTMFDGRFKDRQPENNAGRRNFRD
jgi:hypothetical protein